MKESPLSSPVTLRDIAKKLDVSHVTVSLALRNSPRISPTVRTRVHEAARRMGYRRNPMATALGYQRQPLRHQLVNAKIAWINFWEKPEQLRSYREFDLYWKGAYEGAETHGYRLKEFACSDRISPSMLEETLVAQNIHGILIPPHGRINLSTGLEKIDWNKFCAVRFGYSVSNPSVHMVASNYLRSGLVAVENILRLGYKRVGYVTKFDYIPLFRSGYCVSQSHEAKGELLPILYLATATDYHANLAPLSAWLKEHHPDAILTDCAELRSMLEILGYRVPQDIGLAATSILDGNADAGIDQNSEEIGRAAADTLVALLQRNICGIPSTFREVLVTAKWVDGSTLPPRHRI